MPKKKPLAGDQPLQDFIKAGGRSHAEADFNDILKRAIKPKATKSKKTK